MKARVLIVMVVLAGLITIPTLAQRGAGSSDPLTGTWTGDWGPSAQDRNQVNVELKWDGKTLTGVVKSIRPSRPDVNLSNSSFDASTRTVKMQAEAKSEFNNTNVKYVIEGKVDGNTMSGSWNHDSRKGDFKLTRQ